MISLLSFKESSIKLFMTFKTLSNNLLNPKSLKSPASLKESKIKPIHCFLEVLQPSKGLRAKALTISQDLILLYQRYSRSSRIRWATCHSKNNKWCKNSVKKRHKWLKQFRNRNQTFLCTIRYLILWGGNCSRRLKKSFLKSWDHKRMIFRQKSWVCLMDRHCRECSARWVLKECFKKYWLKDWVCLKETFLTTLQEGQVVQLAMWLATLEVWQTQMEVSGTFLAT